jgi:hypothetical protein
MTRLNRMFPRIVAAQYEVPAHLSADCCDLISRLMTVDIQSRRGTASLGCLKGQLCAFEAHKRRWCHSNAAP